MASTPDPQPAPLALVRPEVAAVIESYRTLRSAPDEQRHAAEDFAKSVVRMVGASGADRAKSLLGSLSALAIWCQQVGIPLEVRAALRDGTIQRFCLEGLPYARPGTRRTLRSNLLFVARQLTPDLVPAKTPAIERSTPAQPYTGAQVDAYLHLAKSQPTAALVDRCHAFICLGRGGGVDPPAMRLCRGVDVRRHGPAVVAILRGSRARIVPIDEPFGTDLLAIARRRPNEHLLGGDAPTRKNITGQLADRIHGGTDLPRLTASRLRATWAASKLGGFKSFCQAAGIKNSAWIFDLLEFVPQRTLDEEIGDLWRG